MSHERASSEIIHIAPCFHVVPASLAVPEGGISIVLRAGSAFGDGRHETTQLCLQAISAFAPRNQRDWRFLDFGSGTGILSIAAAKLGAIALGIDIDESAIASAEENKALSSVAERVSFARSLDSVVGSFELVVGNILRGVLVDAAEALVARLAQSGTLVLSGLVSTDAPEITAHYAPRLGGRRPEIYQRGDWRALVWCARARLVPSG
jgi:ribosomal protein L11 methyltransferase